MKLKYIPNMICIARIILVAPIVWSLLEGRYALALGLIVIAGLSDALDGYLARRFDWRTRLDDAWQQVGHDRLHLLRQLGTVPVW